GGVFVDHAALGTVAIIDPALDRIAQIVAVDNGIDATGELSSGDTAFLASATANRITVLNETTASVTGVVGVGLAPSALAVDPTRQEVYVANAGSANVSVIGGSSPAVVATIAVGA